MTDTRHVSGKWVEGLFNRALGPSIDHELSEMLKAEGLELKRPMQSSYPRDRFVKWVTISARELFPGTEQAQALRQLGAKVVEDMQATGNIRSAALTMARLIGPRRVLKQLVDYVQGQSSLRVKIEEKGKTSAKLELNDGELADFVAGSLEALLLLIGAKRAKVDATQVSPDRSVLSLGSGVRAAGLLLVAGCATVSVARPDEIVGCEGPERLVYRCAFRSGKHSVALCTVDGRLVLRSDERPPLTSDVKLAIQRAEELTVLTLWWQLGPGEQQALLVGHGILDGVPVPLAKFARQHAGVDAEELCEWTPVSIDELYAVAAPITTQFEREGS